MTHIIGIAVAAILFTFVLWLLAGTSKTEAKEGNNDKVIDPSDSYQIGLLIGMTGGTITDAAVARYALQRFEELHGRKATIRDAATVAGLMMSQK